jgi:Flp pilus assembly protein TadG
MSTLRSHLEDETGAQLVEFALIATILFTLVFGIVEFGRVFNAYIVITNAAREGARVAAIGPTAGNPTTRVQTASAGLDMSRLSVSTTTSSTQVTTTVTYQIQIMVPLIAAFFPSNPFPLTASATMRRE